MMRYTLIILAMLLWIPVNAQDGRTKDKKANEFFGQALRQKDYLEYDEALDLVNKALKRDENFGDAWLLKGELLQLKKEIPGAIEAYAKALEINPMDKYALFEMGKIYFNMANYAESLQFLNQLQTRRDLGNMKISVDLLIQNCEFAIEAIKNPVPYNPINLGPNINTEQEEYFPGLTVDEERFFFTRRDGSLPLTAQNEDLFMSEYGKEGWKEAENLGPPVNTRENEGAFSTSPDGKYLFFTSCMRRGGKGRCDIWLTWQENGKWREPLNLGAPINTAHWESQPSIAPDGITIYFASDRPGGYGGSDIWKSVFSEEGWSEPENLGPEINTLQDEEFPFIHPDGRTLYFTSMGHPGMGKRDVFMSRKDGNGWTPAKNLGYPINQSGDEFNLIVNRKGDKAYFATSSGKDGYGGMDIYEFDLYDDVRPVTVSYVRGIVFDSEDKTKIRGRIELKRLSDGELISATYSDVNNGEFLIPLPSDDQYAFKAEADGYLMYSANFSLDKTSKDMPYVLNIPLVKIKLNADVVLENIFFETNKYELHPDSKTELQSFAEFMKKNASIKVEISGHTDNVGSAQSNQVLSENRAKAVYAYLLELGIDESRLSYKGYGATKPRDTNDTEEGRAKNRRTEFRITGL